MQTRNALILGGKTGLLGQALAHVMKMPQWQAFCPGRNELDVFDSSEIKKYIKKHNIDTIFNTIAYTAVDQAEDDPEQAHTLNRDLPALLGKICQADSISLVHYSTDFVFNGSKTTPYTTEDQATPQSVYGKTKLLGEKALLSNTWDKLIIIRTAWLFGPFKTNFVDKIISLARENKCLNIVHDQVGSPTYTIDLAKHSLKLAETDSSGVFHLANKGQASWCELASEAIKCAGLYCSPTPVTSSEYPQKAKRPPYSVLDCSKYSMITGCKPRTWTQSLRDYVYHYQETD